MEITLLIPINTLIFEHDPTNKQLHIVNVFYKRVFSFKLQFFHFKSDASDSDTKILWHSQYQMLFRLLFNLKAT